MSLLFCFSLFVLFPSEKKSRCGVARFDVVCSFSERMSVIFFATDLSRRSWTLIIQRREHEGARGTKGKFSMSEGATSLGEAAGYLPGFFATSPRDFGGQERKKNN